MDIGRSQPLASGWRPDKNLVDGIDRRCRQGLDAAWALLRDLVDTDSYARDVDTLDRVVAMTEPRWRELGFATSVQRTAAGLPVLLADRVADPGAPTVLLLGHLDTVFPPGTAASRPFRVDGDCATGAGVADMKGGVVAAWLGIKAAVAATGGLDHINLRIVNNTDEEAGSTQSRSLIEAACAGADLALVLEPGRPDGSLVTERRGLRRYRVTVHGKPAHTGVNPWMGVNANEALARMVTALHALNDRERFLSVTVALMRGGAAINIVPDEATAEVDVRLPDMDVAQASHRAIEEIVADAGGVAGATAEYDIIAERPPMVPQPGALQAVGALQQVADALGFELPATATGGASDGCFASALGVPTVDGLGPVGDGYHTPLEFLRSTTLGQRAALLGCFLASLAASRSTT